MLERQPFNCLCTPLDARSRFKVTSTISDHIKTSASSFFQTRLGRQLIASLFVLLIRFSTSSQEDLQLTKGTFLFYFHEYFCLLTAVGPTPTTVYVQPGKTFNSNGSTAVVCLLDAVTNVALAQLIIHPLGDVSSARNTPELIQEKREKCIFLLICNTTLYREKKPHYH